MNVNIIETSGLGKRYGSTWALRECSLAVPAGHVTALVGPNGAGKTTLLTLALARRPRLLVLDEPVAMLDPLARHDFMALVLTAAADDGVSVLLSSHVLAELERVADYLILLSRGRVQVAGEVDDLIASHRVLTGPAAEADRYTERPLVHARRADAQAHLLVRATADDPVPPRWEAHPVGLEELAMAYLREPGAGALPGPARGRSTQPSEVTR
jgi:ABC-2 type transport system ATP-binding protein